MTTATSPYISDFARRHALQGLEQGLAQGVANAVIVVMASRGIEVPQSARERITACTDTQQLNAWLQRASTATTLDEVLGETNE